jgi:HD-GYP domain-containing protein (c-di-GMP phosphodiesterase class II)
VQELFGKAIFLDNIFPIFWFKLAVPLSLSQSADQQLETIVNGAYVHDLSKSFADIFDHPEEKLRGSPVGPLLRSRGQDALNTFRAVIASLVAGEYSTVTKEYGPLHMPDGSKVWVSITIKGLVNDGFVSDLFGSMTDITDQQISSDFLRRNIQLLEQSQRAARVGGWELDIQSGELYWTEETYRIHEATPGVFMPTVDAGVDLFLPNSRLKIKEALEAAINKGQGYDLELETYTTKGNLITVRTTGDVTLREGKPIKVTGIFQDITEQKTVERHLNQLLVEKELALSSANLGSWEFDVNSGEFQLSDIERKFFDLPVGDCSLSLEEFFSKVHPDDLGDIHALIYKVRGENKVENARYRVLKSNGEVRYIHGSAVSFSYRSSANSSPVVRMIGIDRDITDEVEGQDKLINYANKLKASLDGTVTMAMELGELRDPYTTGHEARVAQISVQIGKVLGLDDSVIQALDLAGKLHDIGKFVVPVEILSKPGRLTEIEFDLVKGHALAGYNILKRVDFPWPVAEFVLQHHERLDGSGYPRGLKGDEISLEARILAVADVVESMSSHRPYRPALGIEVALAEIERGRGTTYDAKVADACFKLFRVMGYKLQDEHLDHHIT